MTEGVGTEAPSEGGRRAWMGRPGGRDGRGRNRQLVELALRAGRLGAWDWDADTGEMRWTEMLEVMHGLRPGNFAGTFAAFLVHVHPEDRGTVQEAFLAALEAGSLDLEYRIVCPDGSIRWLECHGRVLRGRKGMMRRMTGVCADVTERKREEGSLALLAELGAALALPVDMDRCLASLADLVVSHLADYCHICVLDDDGRLLASLARRRCPEEGQGAIDGLCPQHLRSNHPVARVARTGRPLLYEAIDEETLLRESRSRQRLLRALVEGGLRSAVVVPLTAGRHSLGAMIVAGAAPERSYSARDLALLEELGRRVGLALENARLYARLQRSLEAKDEFLGLLSHELRTPITAIYGGARMLRTRGRRLDAEAKDHILADIEQESERLFRLLEDLLALARLELGQRVEVEPVLVERVAAKVVAAFRERVHHHSLELRVEGESRPVAAQPVYLQQVLRNLLHNAIKYSPPDSPIEVRVLHHPEQVEVHVLDRGPGVAEEDLGRIFERFYRSGASASRSRGGGIGLTVCKRLVEAQGGHIWAQLREGGGLDVAFSLPLWEEDEP
ncbi:MAG TPA: PAS domain-containing sensor histidine kinase [Dehalococcoidia bacterium]|nr:PAS domain-containing sensor histidine kinase [Dehalococcoidia bacterium]